MRLHDLCTNKHRLLLLRRKRDRQAGREGGRQARRGRCREGERPAERKEKKERESAIHMRERERVCDGEGGS